MDTLFCVEKFLRFVGMFGPVSARARPEKLTVVSSHILETVGGEFSKKSLTLDNNSVSQCLNHFLDNQSLLCWFF